MEVSNPAAVLMIVGGLITLILLLHASQSHVPEERDLRRARKKLKASTAVLERQRRGAPVAPAQVREAIESIAACTRILRQTADESQAPVLESIARSAMLVSSVLERAIPSLSRAQRGISGAPARVTRTSREGPGAVRGRSNRDS